MLRGSKISKRADTESNKISNSQIDQSLLKLPNREKYHQPDSKFCDIEDYGEDHIIAFTQNPTQKEIK